MIKRTFEKIKKIGRKTRILLIATIIIAMTVTALMRFNIINLSASAEVNVEQRTWPVSRGDLELTISGSGPAYSANREEINSLVSGAFIKVYFKEGDTVKKGDLLYEIDDSDAVLNYQKAQNSLSQSEITLNDTVESVSKMKVTAPFNGKVTGVTVKKGDLVNKNSTVLTIEDESKMFISLTFDGIGMDEVELNQKAMVYIQSLTQSVEGRIIRINRGVGTNNEYSVEIEIENPGLLKDGMEANASISTSKGEVWSKDTGKTSTLNSQVIKCEVGGVVKELYVSENQYVNSGSLLLVIEDDSLEITRKTNELKVQELKAQLEYQKKQLEYYKITAPIDGVIISQTIKEGDLAKSGQVISTIANNNLMEMEISIDELDIAKIKEGMDVRATVDALEETSRSPLAGKVTKIAMEGTSQGGVTIYPVKITIENPGNIKGGMNANAEIIISNKENTLYVPVEAVQNMGGRTLVMVKGTEASGGQSSQDWANGRNLRQNGENDEDFASRRRAAASGTGAEMNNRQRTTQNGSNRTVPGNRAGSMFQSSGYYEGAMPKQVEVGINNENYIEIISGLNEGEQVILPPLVQSQAQSQSQMGGGFPVGGFGGIGNRTGGNRSNFGGGSR